MKKTFLLLAALFVGTVSNVSAQKVPENRKVSTEVQFNPFDQDGNTFALESVKLRYFLNDQNALRLNFGLNVDKEKKQPNKDEDDVWTKNTTGSFNIDFGYERHFTPKGRADFYAGGQIGIQKDFAKSKEQYKSLNHWNQETIIEKTYKNRTAGDERAALGFNLTAFAGVDFYLYKGLFVGTELGFRMSTMKPCTTEIKDNEGTTKSKESNRSFNAKFYVEPCLRLGWTF